MNQPLPSETIEYARYVDGLPGLEAISEADLIRKIDDHVSEVITQTGVKKGAIGSLIMSAALDVIRPYLRLSPTDTGTKTITIHVEGGLIQDVTGIPAGYEVRVEDYDHADDTQPTWDAEKQCHVTVYGEEGA